MTISNVRTVICFLASGFIAWGCSGENVEAFPGAGGTGGTAETAGAGGTADTGGTAGTADTSGTAGTAGSGGTDFELLGATCAGDSDCGDLDCFASDGVEFDGEGFPGGLCSRDCSSDDDCADAGSCQPVGGDDRKICVERCAIGAEWGGQPHPDTCSGRWDVGCHAVSCLDSAEPGVCDLEAFDARDDADVPGVCLPACNAAEDCDSRVCDLRTGLCADDARTGLANGEGCDPNNDPDPCEGRCVRAGSDEDVGVCTSPCTSLRGSGACMTSTVPDEPKEQVCVGLAAGDLGWCLPTCDCGTLACPDGMACQQASSAGGYPYADQCIDERYSDGDMCE